MSIYLNFTMPKIIGYVAHTHQNPWAFLPFHTAFSTLFSCFLRLLHQIDLKVLPLNYIAKSLSRLVPYHSRERGLGRERQGH